MILQNYYVSFKGWIWKSSALISHSILLLCALCDQLFLVLVLRIISEALVGWKFYWMDLDFLLVNFQFWGNHLSQEMKGAFLQRHGLPLFIILCFHSLFYFLCIESQICCINLKTNIDQWFSVLSKIYFSKYLELKIW